MNNNNLSGTEDGKNPNSESAVSDQYSLCLAGITNGEDIQPVVFQPATVCEAYQRSRLERLCRYITRPPIATKRVDADKPPAPLSWMTRLKRVFAIDIETCPDCGFSRTQGNIRTDEYNLPQSGIISLD